MSCHAKVGTITLTWLPSSSSVVTSYVIERAAGTSAAAPYADVPSGTTTYVDSNVSGSTTYTYYVMAAYRGWTSSAATAPSITTPPHC